MIFGPLGPGTIVILFELQRSRALHAMQTKNNILKTFFESLVEMIHIECQTNTCTRVARRGNPPGYRGS